MTLYEFLDICENNEKTAIGLYQYDSPVDWEEDSDYGPTISGILYSPYYKKYLNCKVTGFYTSPHIGSGPFDQIMLIDIVG